MAYPQKIVLGVLSLCVVLSGIYAFVWGEFSAQARLERQQRSVSVPDKVDDDSTDNLLLGTPGSQATKEEILALIYESAQAGDTFACTYVNDDAEFDVAYDSGLLRVDSKALSDAGYDATLIMQDIETYIVIDDEGYVVQDSTESAISDVLYSYMYEQLLTVTDTGAASCEAKDVDETLFEKSEDMSFTDVAAFGL